MRAKLAIQASLVTAARSPRRFFRNEFTLLPERASLGRSSSGVVRARCALGRHPILCQRSDPMASSPMASMALGSSGRPASIQRRQMRMAMRMFSVTDPWGLVEARRAQKRGVSGPKRFWMALAELAYHPFLASPALAAAANSSSEGSFLNTDRMLATRSLRWEPRSSGVRYFEMAFQPDGSFSTVLVRSKIGPQIDSTIW